MNKKEALRAFGATLGGALHVIESAEVDKDAKKRDENVAVKIPFKAYRVDHIAVHTVAAKEIRGGHEVIVVNGGATEQIIGLSEKLIEKVDDFKFGENVDKRTFFGNATVPTEITKALNMDEIHRIDDIIEYLKGQREAILDIVKANDLAAKAYDQD